MWWLWWILNVERGWISFSDNQSPFPDGLVAPHPEAGKSLDAAFLKGSPLPSCSKNKLSLQGSRRYSRGWQWGLRIGEWWDVSLPVSLEKDTQYLTSEMSDTPTQRWRLMRRKNEAGNIFINDFIKSLFWSSLGGFLFVFVFRLNSPIFYLTAYLPREYDLSYS